MAKINMNDLKKEKSKKLLDNGPGEPEPKKTKKKVKTGRPKLGRKPLPEDERLTFKITVNFTGAESKKLEETAKNHFNIELPKLVRALLKKHGEI